MEKLVLRVNGMSCTGCEQRIARVLRRVEGVSGVEADHARGRVEVRVDPVMTDRTVLIERIEAAGYEIVAEGVR